MGTLEGACVSFRSCPSLVAVPPNKTRAREATNHWPNALSRTASLGYSVLFNRAETFGARATNGLACLLVRASKISHWLIWQLAEAVAHMLHCYVCYDSR